MTEVFGMPVLGSTESLVGLLARLSINLLVLVIIARAIYYRRYGERDYLFTYVLLNVVTFSLAYLLSRVPIELGFALGLFAVFGILRYRTEAINVRNLTYLFVVIGIALLNALASDAVALVELLLVNTLIAGTVMALEMTAATHHEAVHRILYDRLELIAPGRADELMVDLQHRTGLPITRYRIGDIDLLRDAADITVYYPARDWRAVDDRAAAPTRRGTVATETV